MNVTHIIDSNPLDLSIVQDVLVHNKKISLSESAKDRIQKMQNLFRP